MEVHSWRRPGERVQAGCAENALWKFCENTIRKEYTIIFLYDRIMEKNHLIWYGIITEEVTSMAKNDALQSLSKEELIELLQIYSKNWLAMDGAWFQAAERTFGMDDAMELDRAAWRVFTVAEARRLKGFLGLPERAGLEGLKKALCLRFYENINETDFIWGENELTYRNVDCFVQRARQKKGMEFHPCKSVGLIEYAEFAKVIDDRISCECVSCYPDLTDETCCCSWKFRIDEERE